MILKLLFSFDVIWLSVREDAIDLESVSLLISSSSFTTRKSSNSEALIAAPDSTY